MHTNFRCNTLTFSQSHHCPSTIGLNRRNFLRSLFLGITCFLMLGVISFPTFAQALGSSDQKPGSVLVFPYYNTNATNDTRIAISNVGEAPTDQVVVHLFFLEGLTCTPSDNFICLTPNGGITFEVSEIDPDNYGYLIAVAVDSTNGIPIQKNVLIGNAFVNAVVTASSAGAQLYVGNYAAESFEALSGNPTTNNLALATATLNFNGTTGYDTVPSQFAIQIQNAVDAPGQMIVTAGLNGDMTIDDPLNPVRTAVNGAGQVGTGRVISQQEVPYSFNRFLSPGCQAVSFITDTFPRLSRRLSGATGIIGTGETGLMKIGVGGAVGLILTPQSTNLAAQRQYVGIRALHRTATVTAALTIPTFAPPSCTTLLGN